MLEDKMLQTRMLKNSSHKMFQDTTLKKDMLQDVKRYDVEVKLRCYLIKNSVTHFLEDTILKEDVAEMLRRKLKRRRSNPFS